MFRHQTRPRLTALLFPVLRIAPIALLLRADAVYRERRKMNRLDDAALKDLGLTQKDVRSESSSRTWNAPGHWMR